MGCPEIDVQVLQGYVTGILYDDGDHCAVAHNVGSAAVNSDVVHAVHKDGDAFGIVLIVITDVEFFSDCPVGIEIVASLVQDKDCAVACLLCRANGIQCLAECGAHIGALIGDNAKLRSAVLELTGLNRRIHN